MAVEAGEPLAVNGYHKVPAGFAYVLHAAHTYAYKWHEHEAKIGEVGSGLAEYELLLMQPMNGGIVQRKANGKIDEGKVPILFAAGPALEGDVLLPGSEVVFHVRVDF